MPAWAVATAALASSDMFGGVEQEESAVGDVQRVVRRAEGARRDIRCGLGDDRLEVPHDRRQQGLAVLDARLVADDVDEPGLVGAAGGRVLGGGREHAEGRAVAHAEDDVGAGRDDLLGHAVAALEVGVAELRDVGLLELDVRVDRAGALHEAAGLLEPVHVTRRGEDDAERAGLRHRRGEHAGEVAAFAAIGADARDEPFRHRVGVVVDDDRDAVLRRERRRDLVVAARLRDDEVDAFLGELVEDGSHVLGAVADAVLLDVFGADALGDGRSGDRALLVPAVVLGRLGRHIAQLRDAPLGRHRAARRRWPAGRPPAARSRVTSFGS